MTSDHAADRRIRIGLLLLRLLQAAVYAAAAWELSHRWLGDAALFALAALLQLVAVVRPRLEPWLQLLTVLCVALVGGRFGAVALHVHRVFGPVAAQQALATVGGAAVILPWILAFPVIRLWLSPPRRTALLLLPVALLPALEGARPYEALPGADQLEAVARSAWGAHTINVQLTTIDAGARVRFTPVLAGVPGPATTHAGDALALPEGPFDALIVDIATGYVPLGLIRLGADAPAHSAGRSPAVLPRSVARAEVLPGLWLPRADGQVLRWRSALVSASGLEVLVRGWTRADAALDSATLDTAVGAAAAQLVRNQGADGRYTYIVRGPSGRAGPGYNYPRHAGTSWFLARAWAATGDTAARDGARAALGHLADVSGHADDRAWVLDPERTDGKSWIGTTALAALAHALLDPADPLFLAYIRQIAASVDASGKVRGDMRLADASFPDQPANGYGQGQAMLALAAAERAGVRTGSTALDRAIAYVESGDYAGSRHPVIVGDEHWICLSARAIRDVRGIAAGEGVCDAYVATERWSAPPSGAGIVGATGPAAGGAEALIARAWDTRQPALVAGALAWSRVFLESQYRPADAPLLGRPDALLGAFRDAVGVLDVQIDAVQHIGCALLGAEALVAGRARPGSLP